MFTSICVWHYLFTSRNAQTVSNSRVFHIIILMKSWCTKQYLYVYWKRDEKQCTLVHIGTELSAMKRENLSCIAFFIRVFKWSCLCMLMFCTENMVWCSEQFFQWYVCCICSLHVDLQVRAWRRMIVCVFWHGFSNRHHKRALVHHLFAMGMEKKHQPEKHISSESKWAQRAKQIKFIWICFRIFSTFFFSSSSACQGTFVYSITKRKTLSGTRKQKWEL